MKVLVTGASGFIGRNLVDRLVDEGRSVTALVRTEEHSSYLLSKGINLVYGDLSDAQSLRAATKGKDIAFNLAAALPHHRLEDKEYWRVNVEGVKNLLDACSRDGVKRVVHVSTVGVYGSPPKIDTSEECPFKPGDVYSRTKTEGEKIALNYWKKNKLPLTILRPTIAYGPGDLRPVFLPLFSLIKKRMFVMIGRGDNFLHTLYVDNLVDALLLAASRKEAIGEDFIVGDDPCPTVRQVVETIANVENVRLPSLYLPTELAFLLGRLFDLTQTLGLPAPLTTRRVRFITENKRFKIDKAKKVLGYKPRVSLEEGIKRTYSWYRDQGIVS